MIEKYREILSGKCVTDEACEQAIKELLNLHIVMQRIVLTQDWYEDDEEKNGWLGYGWNEPKGYELEEIIEFDKFSNPTKAIFKYVA